jgi:3-isopropylmalate dehydrogenase
MVKTYKILVLPGDHAGPEVVEEALKVLREVERLKGGEVKFELHYDLFGGSSIDKHGTPITEQVLQKAEKSDAVLFGAVGGPRWDDKRPRPESAVLALRKRLNCWANIRPCRFPCESLASISVLREDVVKGTDFIVLRENCGGAYFGEKVEHDDYASDVWGYSRPEVERITRMAGYLATKHGTRRIISCDKANVLANSRLWRRVVTDVVGKEFPDVQLTHQLADSATVVMMQKPRSLNGIVLCDNTFGDILSDESAVIVGSLGLLPSASLASVPGDGEPRTALYEPSHGSAPDLAKGKVNPIATILSVALLFRYTVQDDEAAKAIEEAVRIVLEDTSKGGRQIRTGDLGGSASTSEMGDAIVAELATLINKSR